MIEKTRIEIRVVLPDVPDSRDQCVHRLADLLAAKKGIDSAHVIDKQADMPDEICIHFDRTLLDVGEVRTMTGVPNEVLRAITAADPIPGLS